MLGCLTELTLGRNFEFDSKHMQNFCALPSIDMERITSIDSRQVTSIDMERITSIDSRQVTSIDMERITSIDV